MRIFKKTLEQLGYWLLIVICLAIMIFTAYSCSPLKRLENLQKRNPHLFDKVQDTIVIQDTIYYSAKVLIEDDIAFFQQAQKADTTLPIESLLTGQPIILTGNGFRTALSYNPTNSKNEIFLETVVDEIDTLIPYSKVHEINLEIPFEKTVAVNRFTPYKRARDALRTTDLVTIMLLILLSVICYAIYKYKTANNNKKEVD